MSGLTGGVRGPAADPGGELRARKRALREIKLAERRAMAPEEVARLSVAAQEELLALGEYRAARVVHAYVGIKGNEVRTDRILLETLRSGRRLVVPRVDGDRLAHHEIRSLGELRAAAFGLLEPEACAPLADPADVELVVVPGVAFDGAGGRLGLGKGYYDRFLAGTAAVKAALLYAAQLVAEVPVDESDVRVDLLVTENGAARAEERA